MDRHKFLKIFLVLIITILLARAAYLQIYKGDYYHELSEGNRISVRPINAPRGLILDKGGEIIVSNRLTYNLYLMLNEIPPVKTVEEVLVELSNLSTLKESRLINNYQNADKSSGVESILLARHLSKEDMVIIAESKDALPGILVKESSMRDYIYPETFVHNTGYIGEISKKELISFNEKGYNYRGGDFVGKTGLEKEYEFDLKGRRGAEQIEVNSHGEKIQTLGVKKPKQGNNLYLNINFSLQSALENLINKEFKRLKELAAEDEERSTPTGISAVVMDVNNGNIISSISLPNYNLDLFAKGISIKDYQNLVQDPLKPMLNRTTMTAVPPASIFKLVTGTAAMEELGVRANTNFYDSNGKFYLPNWSEPFRNWNPVGEGKLDFVRAIARSNNIVFYELGHELYKEYNGDMLAQYARDYGLGTKSGIDLPSENAGLVPDEDWKQSQLNEGWYPGDSVNLSIGQGSLLTTPVQIASLISAIAAEGKLYKPQLVDKIVSSQGEVVKDFKKEIKIDLSKKIEKEVFTTLQEGMHNVVNKNYGTASRHFTNFPLKAAGKTGTAQTGGSNHGWFGSFVPYDNPQISVVVFIENGGSSAYAVPIARKIMEYYFGFRNFNNNRLNLHYYQEELENDLFN